MDVTQASGDRQGVTAVVTSVLLAPISPVFCRITGIVLCRERWGPLKMGAVGTVRDGQT
jgi:hypothetical protein